MSVPLPVIVYPEALPVSQRRDDIMRAIRDNADAAAVEAATKSLAADTEAFAATRMNRGIRQALAGKSLQDM